MPRSIEKNHVVEAGDSIDRLALDAGLFAATIWDLPENAALREKRRHPNILAEGDVVAIPKKEVKRVACATGRKHTFRRKGVPSLIRIRLLRDGQPRANVDYSLVAGEETLTGKTDADGCIARYVSCRASSGRLDIEGESYTIAFSMLRPVTETRGVRQRLAHLGYGIAGESDEVDEACLAAVATFQRNHGLTESGSIDEPTRQKLVQVHGDRSA